MDKKHARLRAFKHHVNQLNRALTKFEVYKRRFTWLRLFVFVLGLLAFLYPAQFGALWMTLMVGITWATLFGWVVYLNRKLERSSLRFQIARDWTLTQEARMQLDWARIPASTKFMVADDHPFALDLNITGEKSIFRLLDTTLSRNGSARLHRWLLETEPDLDEIAHHRDLIGELIPLRAFRSRLILNGKLVSGEDATRWDGEALLAWLEDHSLNLLPIKLTLVFSGVLAVLNVILFVLSVLQIIPPYWILTLGMYFFLQITRFNDLKELFDQAYFLARTLEKFRAVLAFLERYSYAGSPNLAALCQPFWDAKDKPSKVLRRIMGIASAASLQRNQILWMIVNSVVPWDLFFLYLLESFKARIKLTLPDWLNRWYELEALNSLANFAYLNPSSIFPEIVKASQDSPLLSVKEIGHPLIPDAERVCNDFSMRSSGEVVLITGSNMSGKSTFLRTLGVNLCLAYAGGTVLAAEFACAPLRLFTCIQVSDSINDGISYFYAEVKRLKALLDALDEGHDFKLFYLIDEIFRGTNNRERELGSRAYVRALLKKDGLGVISTHDLELTQLAAEFTDICNLHFREEVENERMIFDYKLRQGPSPTTNALKIMQIEGLPVDDGE
ncbi:MAG: hypothetical protein JXB38_18455 [Anaerolineales bacterium]|nr:hypothetical protein [Anaerolineales bacterium]